MYINITFIIDNGFDIDLILKLFGSELVGTGMILWAVSLVCLVLMVVLTLVGFFLLTLSAAKRGIQRNIAFPVVGIVLSTAALICFNLMISNLTAALPGIFTGSVNPLAYIVNVLIFVVMIVVNIIYKKKNIQVKYKDVSEFLLPYNERPSTLAKKAAEKEANA